jgi:hypothetical protein
MHSPQRIHLARNSDSGSDPGGRINAGLKVRFEA